MTSKQYLWRAIASGLAPMCLGVGIYGLWRLTRWDFLTFAGLAMLLVGFIVFLFGFAQTVNYAIHAKAHRDARTTRIIRNTALTFILLLANFPAAYWIARAAIDHMICYNVVIRNHSDSPVTNFHILGGQEGDIPIGDLRPGAIEIKRVSHIHRASLDCTATTTVMGQSHPTTITYYRHGRGDDCIVTVNEDGSVTITEDEP